MLDDEMRLEIPRLREENDGVPVIAVVSPDGIRYIAQEERGDVDIGDELWWDHFVAQYLAWRLQTTHAAYLAALDYAAACNLNPHGQAASKAHERVRAAQEAMPAGIP